MEDDEDSHGIRTWFVFADGATRCQAVRGTIGLDLVNAALRASLGLRRRRNRCAR
jgi:hypothetical protein